jgi:serine/threonine-protein kinase
MGDQLTATGQVLGTAAYISPEQAVGEGATAASDRYALAVVAYELLTGSKPFHAEHFAATARAHVEDTPPAATETDPSLPRGVDPVLARGMAKDPSERWESATAMVDELQRAMGSAPPPTEPTRPIAAAPGPPPSRRSGAPLLAGLAALAVLAVLGFVLLSGGDNGRSDGGRQQARSEQPPKKKKREATPTATPTAESTPRATATPTQTPPPPTPTGGTDLTRARQLQLQGFNARRGGDYNAALAASTQALQACGDTRALDPCGYALFEIGADLNALGRGDEAVAYLQRRLDQYGDNSGGEVQAELDKAQGKKPKGPKGPKDKGDG